jgi:AcrR family transcriptional regulator
MSMARRSTTTRRRLTPEDWADAALAAIAEGGLAAVAVEPLAVRLGTTKGSFYWHYSGREALLEAALARWEDWTTSAVVVEIIDDANPPADQLRRLVVRTIEIAERDRVGPALQANATHPAVARTLDRVTRARIDLITTVFTRLGYAAQEARSRALLAYSAYLGHAQLAHATPQALPATDEERRAYLDRVLHLLTR